MSLAEVDEAWGAPGSLRDLAARCGYSWVFVPAFEFGRDRPDGGFGNALLTRLPILAVQQWQLLWPPRPYDGSEPSEHPVGPARQGSADAGAVLGRDHSPAPHGRGHARTDALRRLATLASAAFRLDAEVLPGSASDHLPLLISAPQTR